MDCKELRRHIDTWVDGELGAEQGRAVEGHMEGCSHCRAEVDSSRAFSRLFKAGTVRLRVSDDFEQVFWKKALARHEEPWFVRVLKDRELLIPFPNVSQVVAMLTLAFLIGGVGGLYVNRSTYSVDIKSQKAFVQYLSGFQEFRGVPSSSVAATYLKKGA